MLLNRLAVDPQRGLSASEAKRRLATFGSNALRQIKARSSLSILAAQFKSLLVALLVAAVVAAIAFGEWIKAGAILAVLTLNAIVGFAAELRGARSMEALRKMGATKAIVRRDGELEIVAAAALALATSCWSQAAPS